MRRGKTGRYETITARGKRVRTFVPKRMLDEMRADGREVENEEMVC